MYVQDCIVQVNENTGYSRMSWSIGDKMKTRISGVCKTAFCNAYRVSSSHVDNIVKELKVII
jgi:hypothetical protein